MKIKLAELESLITDVLLTKYSHKIVDLIRPVVVYGEITGITSHGIIRLISDKYSFTGPVTTEPVVKQITKFSSLIDMKGASGMIAGAMAVEEVIKKARKTGFGIVGTKGSIGSSGSLAYYAEKMANQGLISIIMARAVASVAPFTSIEKLLGSNPIAFGIPKSEGVFVLDMATSALTRGALVRAALLGEAIPEGTALDNEGNMTSDPNKALEGAILPFGGSYKSSGLSIIVEMLAGVFTGAGFSTQNVAGGWGNLFIAIDPKLLFLDLEEFKSRVSKLVEIVRNSKTKSGEKVRIPGELEMERRNNALKTGFVEVDESTVKDLVKYLEITH